MHKNYAMNNRIPLIFPKKIIKVKSGIHSYAMNLEANDWPSSTWYILDKKIIPSPSYSNLHLAKLKFKVQVPELCSFSQFIQHKTSVQHNVSWAVSMLLAYTGPMLSTYTHILCSQYVHISCYWPAARHKWDTGQRKQEINSE